MIFCEPATEDHEAIDRLVVFASQLRANGVAVVISEDSLPVDLRAGLQFDAASFLSNLRPGAEDTVVLLGAHRLSAERAGRLRSLASGAAVNCIAYGTFDTRQTEISIASRIAYALNKEPQIINHEQANGLPAIDHPVVAAPMPKRGARPPRIALVMPDLDGVEARAALHMLQADPALDIEIVTSGETKTQWIASDGYRIPAWHLGELLPRALAARYDAVVLYEKPTGWARMQALVANLVGSGAVMIDGTLERSWHQAQDVFIPGPARIPALLAWMKTTILPRRAMIATETVTSPLAKSFAMPGALRGFVAPQPRQRQGAKGDLPQVLFVPTNGVGLGHAKRCSLVADAMRAAAKPQFAAFPSCIGMLTASGFDSGPLVSRSADHSSHANDLVNANRLSAMARDSAAVVFDGGYVFDSVMRAAADHARPSIWIRRGLWQASQNNQVARDRQKSFSRIIIPCEAFDELNTPGDVGENTFCVGPIVQRVEQDPQQAAVLKDSLRKELAQQGKKLVVTMLGGGVAADRRAQINAVCAHLATRDDVMHLLVVWPTATTDPGWFHYPNTRVVQSIHASVLIPLADLFVSAVGYNSFHEAIYAKTPTIFVPQMAGFMDDQRARARAAAERELAVLVEPWELLQLTQAIEDCLGDQAEHLRDKLRGINLPQPGTEAAAHHILELVT